MKLSVMKKFGFIHVRGGRIVTVTHAHQVPIGNESQIEDDKYRRKWDGEKWVTAKEGDLAVEIIAVKTDKLLGYSYLSGDAVRLNLYRADAPHWFEVVKAYRANVAPFDDRKMPPEVFISGLMRCKYADARVVAFHLPVQSEEDGEAASKAFQEAYRYIPVAMTDEEDLEHTTHLLGEISLGFKKWHTLVHFQPPKDASDYAATGFQIELVYGSPTLEPYEPWAVDKAVPFTTPAASL